MGISAGLGVIGLIAVAWHGHAYAQPRPHQVPATGPQLTPAAVAALNGKTCWGYFGGEGSPETARGAIFVQFSSTGIGEFWRKYGKAAQDAASKASNEGYDTIGATTRPEIADTKTELTFRAGQWFFDWFIKPNGDGSYDLRAVGYTQATRGAVGKLNCR